MLRAEIEEDRETLALQWLGAPPERRVDGAVQLAVRPHDAARAAERVIEVGECAVGVFSTSGQHGRRGLAEAIARRRVELREREGVVDEAVVEAIIALDPPT